jgi:hypothetical protein
MRIFTPHTLGAIIRRLRAAPEKVCVVRRHGIRTAFTLSDEPDEHGFRVHWSAKIDGQMYAGTAGTVWDAAREIEHAKGAK